MEGDGLVFKTNGHGCQADDVCNLLMRGHPRLDSTCHRIPHVRDSHMQLYLARSYSPANQRPRPDPPTPGASAHVCCPYMIMMYMSPPPNSPRLCSPAHHTYEYSCSRVSAQMGPVFALPALQFQRSRAQSNRFVPVHGLLTLCCVSASCALPSSA